MDEKVDCPLSHSLYPSVFPSAVPPESHSFMAMSWKRLEPASAKLSGHSFHRPIRTQIVWVSWNLYLHVERQTEVRRVQDLQWILSLSLWLYGFFVVEMRVTDAPVTVSSLFQSTQHSEQVCLHETGREPPQEESKWPVFLFFRTFNSEWDLSESFENCYEIQCVCVCVYLFQVFVLNRKFKRTAFFEMETFCNITFI